MSKVSLSMKALEIYIVDLRIFETIIESISFTRKYRIGREDNFWTGRKTTFGKKDIGADGI